MATWLVCGPAAVRWPRCNWRSCLHGSFNLAIKPCATACVVQHRLPSRLIVLASSLNWMKKQRQIYSRHRSEGSGRHYIPTTCLTDDRTRVASCIAGWACPFKLTSDRFLYFSDCPMILSPCLAQNSVVFSMTSLLGCFMASFALRFLKVVVIVIEKFCCHPAEVDLVKLVYALSHTILHILRQRCSNMLGPSECFYGCKFSSMHGVALF